MPPFLAELLESLSAPQFRYTLTLLFRSFGTTVAIFFLTLLYALPLGLLICLFRMSKFSPLAWLTRAYISVMRGTPLMLQLLVIFFGPYFLFGIPLSTSYRFPAVIIAFSLNYAAYFAEIFRGGLSFHSPGAI